MSLGDLLEVDAVLCTRLQAEDGVYTGELQGKNCRGEEKVARLFDWCASAKHPDRICEVRIWRFSGGTIKC
jgi:phosphoserine phosphatase